MKSKYRITIRMASIYRKASKKDKPRIRDEYMAITGLRNKEYAETKLNRYAIDPPPEPAKRKRKPGHGGPSSEGEFAHTLNMTDMATGWTEFMAILGRAQERVFAALRAIRDDLPFPLRGIDSDNDKPFINDQLERYAKEHGIEFTRCRPYHKNDQAHIEQKNWTFIGGSSDTSG